MHYFIFIFFILFAYDLQAFSEVKFKEKIEEETKAYFKKNNGAGLAITVIKQGYELEKPFEKTFCYGFSKRSKKINVNESTQFRLGSISKIFAAFLLLKYVQENKVSLEGNVESYFPKTFIFPSFHEKKVKLIDLALETSGLPALPTIPMKVYQATDIEIKNYFKNYKLIRAPGKKYEASDLGYGCLAYLLSRLGGKSFERLIKEEILNPLKMEETYFSLPLSKMNKLATGYKGITEVGDNFVDRDGSFFKTIRGFTSNIEDMKRCLSFLLRRVPTGFEGVLKYLYKIEYTYPENPTRKISIGWQVAPLSFNHMISTYYQHSSYQGFTHFIGFIPEIGGGIVILSNADYSVDQLGMTLLKALIE